MNKETKKIRELTEKLIKIEQPLRVVPPFPITDPSKVRSYLQQSREPIALLQNLREQLAKMGPVTTFNTTVKRKLIEIKKKKTPTDRSERYLRRVQFLGVILSSLGHQDFDRSFDRLMETLGLGKYSQSREDLKLILQDSQLKTELDKFFGPVNVPDEWWTDDFAELDDFMFEVGYAAHESTFKREKYLDLVTEVLAIVDPEQYGKRSQSVGTPIVSQTVPPALGKHLQRLKTCYLLGLDEMTIVFCRSVLEVALFEALQRRGKLQGGGNADDRFWPFGKLLGLTDHQMLDSKMKERARDIRLLAGDILHNKETSEVNEKTEDTSPCLEEMALDSVKDTFDIVEALYG